MTLEVQQIFVPLVEDAMRIYRDFLRREAELQGHKQTGRAAASMEIEVESKSGAIIGKVVGEDYMLTVDAGVKPGKVKYRIQVMIDYFRRWGLPLKEATSAAWATRTIHLREGIPTRGSYAFSRTGKRKGFIMDGADRATASVKQLFEKNLGERIELVMTKSEGGEVIKTVEF